MPTIVVEVMPKAELLDPQGKAVAGALARLGHSALHGVRVGKRFEITVDEDEIEDARWFTRAEMKAEAEAGTLVLPGGVSISRSLVEHWYGGPLPGSW